MACGGRDLRLFWECVTGAGPHWRLGARRIRGSPELASEWGKRSSDVSCASVPAPAQTSLARRARTEGEGALEASGSELTSKGQMLGPPDPSRRSSAHPPPHELFHAVGELHAEGRWINEPRLLDLDTEYPLSVWSFFGTLGLERSPLY